MLIGEWILTNQLAALFAARSGAPLIVRLRRPWMSTGTSPATATRLISRCWSSASIRPSSVG
ncbi:hypothetical protein [Mycobacterium sp.]|uniref:hypothetical protein n=1 Tax=Mycobacterium sp. TaxID=1785 RepID=UPI0031E12C81